MVGGRDTELVFKTELLLETDLLSKPTLGVACRGRVVVGGGALERIVGVVSGHSLAV